MTRSEIGIRGILLLSYSIYKKEVARHVYIDTLNWGGGLEWGGLVDFHHFKFFG